MKTETGGAAFPNYRSDEFANWGMTLRDYFAAKAMQGLFASHSFDPDSTPDDMARDAYKMADVMLRARIA